MTRPALTPDLCVIGAGAAGMTVATEAARLGASVVLIEKGNIDDGHLSFGYIPSKSLLAAARAAHNIRDAEHFGIHANEPTIDFAAVMAHVRDVISGHVLADARPQIESLGITLLQGTARFCDPRGVITDDSLIRAHRTLIATGSRPYVPRIPGLETVPVLTTESVYDVRERPAHLLVLGGGPVGCELAQAFRRLGSRVTIVDGEGLLSDEDPDMVEVLRARLVAEGIDLREGWQTIAAEAPPNTGHPDHRIRLTLMDQQSRSDTLTGSHLLIALGWRPALKGLRLRAADIIATPTGIRVDRRLRTTNRRVFALGNVTGEPIFTHATRQAAQVVLRQALFHLPARLDTRTIPRVCYTDPEVAWVGLTESEARRHHGTLRVQHWPFGNNDRARCERASDGMVKVIVTQRGRILGAGIVGRDAGDLIQPWAMAIRHGLRITALASMIAPYPTRSEASKRAAAQMLPPLLCSDRTRTLVRLISWLRSRR